MEASRFHNSVGLDTWQILPSVVEAGLHSKSAGGPCNEDREP